MTIGRLRGSRPVKDFIDSLSNDYAAEVVAAMKEVALLGLSAARHLRGQIYEVRADGRTQSYRVLFAPEGQKGRVLLALEAISKKTQKTPPGTIELAERRLRGWRERRGDISLTISHIRYSTMSSVLPIRG